MKIVRKLIVVLGFLMGAWVVASFAGVMINAGNPGFWTTSLMWSLLASVVVMPGLVVAHHANKSAERRAAKKRMEQAKPPAEEQPAFVDEGERQRAVWPIEAEENQSSRE